MALLALAPACGFSTGTTPGDDSGTPIIDAMPDAERCFGSYVKVCFTSTAPVAGLTLNDDIDTDGSICNTGNDQTTPYCVVAGAGLTIPTGKTIRAYGSKPIIFLSTTTFQLIGNIDVSSVRMSATTTHLTGAGAALAATCTGNTAADHNSGGYGGTFGGKGGTGEGVGAAMGGQATAAAGSFPALRGGCPGGAGSTDTGGAIPGAGGAGGGAVMIIAQSIQIDGQINASGAGGRGGPNAKAGGGGGGSGGMIVLEAAALTGAGMVWANGGGGGQGGAGGGGGASGPGDDGMESPGPATVAIGGQNGTREGGRGGAGSLGIRITGDQALGGAAGNGGGGAGGGGAGVIYAPDLASAMISPASRSVP